MNKITLPDNITKIIEMLESSGFQAFVVGGAVRDSILGRSVSDYDVCTNATPDEVSNLLDKWYRIIPSGIKHGTITAIDNNISKTSVEITTFRSDGKYSDNRRPDDVFFVSTIDEDLSRRDFTMNAIAYNPKTGFVDLFGGIDDIRVKLVKCVGNPNDRFNEDALRMMRAIRFCAQLNFGLEHNTELGIMKNASLILNVSAERIQTELNKILISNNPLKIETLNEDGLLQYIIPELSRCFGFNQNNPHHIYELGEHTMNTLKNVPDKLHLRLTALLHDIGKFDIDKKDMFGVSHFPKHSIISHDLSLDILKRLKYDNDMIEKVTTLILHHMDEIIPEKKYLKRVLNKLGEEATNDLLIFRMADAKAQHPEEFDLKLEKIHQSFEIIKEIIAEKECFSLKDLAINGDDLKKLGFQEGKIIGDTLKRLMEIVIDNPDKNTKENLIKELEYSD
jgi:tRNA nucleotidyltransferase (CCA-adding enzyme)